MTKGQNPMNYYDEFLKLLNVDFDDMIKTTPGFENSQKTLKEVYEQIEQHAQVNQLDFDQTLADCLAANNELFFNLGWSAGWTAGAVKILKLLGVDKPDSQEIITFLSK